jgi:hypothetical protein
VPKRPPYLDIILTAAAMVFLTLIVFGAVVGTRPDTFEQVTMRSE